LEEKVVVLAMRYMEVLGAAEEYFGALQAGVK